MCVLYSIGSWLKPMPGRPALLNDVLSVPPVARLLVALAPATPQVGERRERLPQDRGGFRRPEDRCAADAARAGIHIEIGVELGKLRLGILDRAEMLFT